MIRRLVIGSFAVAIVAPSTTCKSFEVAAGKAEVLTLSGGTWDGKSGALPDIR